MKKLFLCFTMALLGFATVLGAAEYHVSKKGSDHNPGHALMPFLSIGAAAAAALPGDVITVHEGTYREWVNPPRGGQSEDKRITYRAAAGERVILKGSERILNWELVEGTVWKTTLEESFFGDYNPYRDEIFGDWFTSYGRKHHTGEVYINGRALYEADSLAQVRNPVQLARTLDPEFSTWQWCCQTQGAQTTIWANFHGKNPNQELVEINVRRACFFPLEEGINYITVSGFEMSQAATQWAPPTAGQIGLIGTHWSKGWIIENNIVSHSKCSGIALGKDYPSGHNVWRKDRSKDGSVHYIEVVFRALKRGWNKEQIGSHIVRNNTIFDCGQTGICGALGAAFSEIRNNHIYNIWNRRQFYGQEMAGIKLHAAIDVLLEGNRIHATPIGVYMDWQAQGTQITRNLLYDNDLIDIYMEVDHGPYLVDNNILLSHIGIFSMSQGGAFVHNLIAGKVHSMPDKRFVPYHFAHSTDVHSLAIIYGGDDRFYNNIFSATNTAQSEELKNDERWQFRLPVYGTRGWDELGLISFMADNVYGLSATASEKYETHPILLPEWDARIKWEEKDQAVYLEMLVPDTLCQAKATEVNTARLGKAKLPGLPWVNPDDSALAIDCDYFGRRREKPTIGPFEHVNKGAMRLKVW